MKTANSYRICRFHLFFIKNICYNLLIVIINNSSKRSKFYKIILNLHKICDIMLPLVFWQKLINLKGEWL